MKEHIHIAMPVYNGEDHLEEALESLLGQSHTNFEIFLCDNASTDRTPEIAHHVARKDARLRYFPQANWLNATDNWSRTYALAGPGTKFLMWASDDDLWAPDYIDSLLPALSEQPNVVLSFSQVRVISPEGDPIENLYATSYLPGETPFQRIRSIISSGNYSAIYGLMRTDAITWRPCFFDAPFGSDLWLLMRLATAGPFSVIPRILLFKRTGGIGETQEDPSTRKTPETLWKMGPDEWKLLSELKLNVLAQRYVFYRLKVLGKAFFPHYRTIDWYLWPFFALHVLRRNHRFFGIRSRLKQRLSKFVESRGN